MASLISSLRTSAPSLPNKKKNSPSLDRIPIPNSLMHASSLASFWNPAACHMRKDMWNVWIKPPVELCLAGITTIEAANEFLNHYIKKFNAKFSFLSNNIKPVFVEQPSDEKINLILAGTELKSLFPL